MILGVDPGAHGACVIYDPVTNSVLQAHNIPTLSLSRNGKNKTLVDPHALLTLVKTFAPLVKHAFLELVGGMRGQGISSIWSFCRCDTALEMSVIAAGIPFDRVAPQVWKRALNTPADKDGARARASQLMPASARLWTEERGRLTKENAIGIAEAALIAYYGARKHGLTTMCATS